MRDRREGGRELTLITLYRHLSVAYNNSMRINTPTVLKAV